MLFYVFGGLAVGAGAWMITRRNPLASALSLVVAFVALAALYAVLQAHLLFAIQLWVYAGAVMVLVLFVIMLLDLRREEASERAFGAGKFAIGALVAGVLALKALAVLWEVRADPEPVGPEFGTTAAVAERLFSGFALQFEIVSILLLAVIVAVVVLARRRRAGSEPEGR